MQESAPGPSPGSPLSHSKPADLPPGEQPAAYSQPADSPSVWRQVERHLAGLQLLVAAGLFLLIAVTWRLWTPQTAFPRIPLLGPQYLLPATGEWLVLAVLLLSLGCRAVLAVLRLLGTTAEPARTVPGSPRLERACGLISCLCLVLLVAGDQHRLQAWAWHLGLLSLLIVLQPVPRLFRLSLYLTASIYVWSAWSKMDVTFFQSAGPYLVGGLLKSVGLSWQDVPAAARTALCGLLPAAELLTGVGLLWPRTRRLAVAGSCLMHLALLLTLGPWGLGHSAGVLLWNVFFLVQNPLLASGLTRLSQAAAEQGTAVPATADNRHQPAGPTAVCSTTVYSTAASSVLAVAVLWPLFEPWGLCDSWLSWNLYSSRSEQVRLFVRSDVRQQLSPAARQVTDEARPGQLWCRLRDDQWSLQTTGAPVLPDSRFRLGVALAIARMVEQPEAVRVHRSSRAGRLTGHRRQEDLYGARAIRAALNRHWLNAEPPAPHGRAGGGK
ncbi:MAG: hypothetical protein KDA79_11850 [Planctomycetaceae bacterium]|nr:hypothetical protein [Planctomycetaceae bacterium]